MTRARAGRLPRNPPMPFPAEPARASVATPGAWTTPPTATLPTAGPRPGEFEPMVLRHKPGPWPAVIVLASILGLIFGGGVVAAAVNGQLLDRIDTGIWFIGATFLTFLVVLRAVRVLGQRTTFRPQAMALHDDRGRLVTIPVSAMRSMEFGEEGDLKLQTTMGPFRLYHAKYAATNWDRLVSNLARAGIQHARPLGPIEVPSPHPTRDYTRSQPPDPNSMIPRPIASRATPQATWTRDRSPVTAARAQPAAMMTTTRPCPRCKSVVAPLRTATGGLLCPVCRNTGRPVAPVPPRRA